MSETLGSLLRKRTVSIVTTWSAECALRSWATGRERWLRSQTCGVFKASLRKACGGVLGTPACLPVCIVFFFLVTFSVDCVDVDCSKVVYA